MTRKVEQTDTGESASDDTDRSGRVDRRDYLRALGGIGVGGLGAAGAGFTGTAAAQTGFDEAAADQRIRDNQMGPLTVEVVDSNGSPVSDVSVSVEMTEHDFDWGNMVNVGNLLDRFGEGSDYRQYLQELFNTAVLENAHKWSIWEGNTQRADQAVDWLDQHGFRIRGHTCVYGVTYAIPDDVLSAARNGDGQTVRDRTMEHLRRIITHYGDQIQEWDVVNEAVHRGHLQQGEYPGIDPENPMSSNPSPWTTDLLADWYREAESVIAENGLDVKTVTNDYNTMTWDQDAYYEEVQLLLDQGIDLDAIGHQTHLGSSTNPSGQPWTYSTINDVFERFAQLDATQRITEFDMAGDGWSGQQQRAEAFRAFLKTAYGHPDVDQFMIWGMWDETHWRDEAPFFDEDWSEKPALDVWRNLVLDEWWTSESGTTAADGTLGVDAFLGEHEVQVTAADGSTVTETVAVTDPSAGAQVTVTIDGAPPTTQSQQPYDGSPIAIPGRIEAEAFDIGGPGVSYSDATAENEGGDYRTETAVDVRGASTDSGYAVNTIESGEWLEYTVDVQEAGTYSLSAQVASDASGGAFHLEVAGTDVSGSVGFDATGGWTTWETVTASGIELAAGEQVIRLAADESWWDLDYIELTQSGNRPPAVGDARPTDPDGDGLYEDLSGDGEVNFPDVNLLFQHRDAAVVTDNLAYYDFTGDGSINLQDVISIFRMV